MDNQLLELQIRFRTILTLKHATVPKLFDIMKAETSYKNWRKTLKLVFDAVAKYFKYQNRFQQTSFSQKLLAINKNKPRGPLEKEEHCKQNMLWVKSNRLCLKFTIQKADWSINIILVFFTRLLRQVIDRYYVL